MDKKYADKISMRHILFTILLLMYSLVLVVLAVVYVDQILLNIGQIILIVMGLNEMFEFNTALNTPKNIIDRGVVYASR